MAAASAYEGMTGRRGQVEIVNEIWREIEAKQGETRGPRPAKPTKPTSSSRTSSSAQGAEILSDAARELVLSITERSLLRYILMTQQKNMEMLSRFPIEVAANMALRVQSGALSPKVVYLDCPDGMAKPGYFNVYEIHKELTSQSASKPANRRPGL